MHKLATALLLVLFAQDTVLTGPHRKVGAAIAPCTPPPTNFRYAGYNTGNDCNDSNGSSGFGVPCTTLGATVDYFANFNGGSNAFQVTTAIRPTYVPSALNGKAAIRFNNALSQFFSMQIPNISSVSPILAYAVFKPATHTLGSIFSYVSGTGGSIQYFYNGSNMELNNLNRNVIVTGTHTLTLGTWYVSVMTYDYGTGNGALFLCSAGSCVADGTGNLVTGAWGNDVVVIGGSSQAGFLDGDLAEAGWINSNATANTVIAAYAQCQYAL